ncbi:MAG TPA: VWA domain-containing protein, partial [Candidatus Tenderia electrophaga]|nr:VWA domain-containing protein [Candidatus Tenderia electrophaga]
MDSCQLLRPEWLWLILPLALLLFLFSRRRSRTGSWRTVCDAQLLPFILQGREVKASPWPLLLTALAGLLAIIALSGPVCEQREQPVFRDQSALVIALDLSRSMDATDIKPSRLVRARLKLIDILKQRQEGQTALIVYAAQAFTVSPLTDDTDTIISLVGSLDSNMMPQQGSNTSTAIA